MDRRICILDLKLKIAEIFKKDLDQIVFRRGGYNGMELVEDELSLKQAQFYNNICLFL